jgi:DNA-binding response OmpR family regulator
MAESNMHVAGARVLLIDDDLSLHGLVSMMLARAGILATCAATAVEGRRLLDEEVFQLLILDLMLPDVDGFEFLKVLRQDERFGDLPVLILSARVDPEAIDRALKLGADGYLTKPYLPQNLNERVTTLLSQQRRQRPPPVLFQEM